MFYFDLINNDSNDNVTAKKLVCLNKQIKKCDRTCEKGPYPAFSRIF